MRFILIVFILSFSTVAMARAVRCQNIVSGKNFVNWILVEYGRIEEVWPQYTLETARSERSAKRKQEIQDHLNLLQEMITKEIDKVLDLKELYPFSRYQFLTSQIEKIVFRISNPRAPEISSTQLEDYIETPFLIDARTTYTFLSESQNQAKKIQFSNEIVQQLFSSTRYHGVDAGKAFLHSITMDVPGKNIKPLHDGIYEIRTIGHQYGHLRIFGFFLRGAFYAVKLSTATDHGGKKFNQLIESVISIRNTYN